MTSAAGAMPIHTAPQIQPAAEKGFGIGWTKTGSLPWGETLVFAPQKVSTSEKPVRIYLASGGQGGGHVSPMDGVAKALAELRPDAEIIYDRRLPVPTFKRNLLDHAVYKGTNSPLVSVSDKIREFTDQYEAVTARVLHLVESKQIDLVYTNHRFLGQVLANEMPDGMPLVISTADPGKVHIGWYHRRTKEPKSAGDRLFVINNDGVAHAGKHGVPRERIEMLGYPVRKAFEAIANMSKDAARAKLKIEEGKKVIVMSAGNGRNPGDYVAQVNGLLSHPEAGKLHIIALAGGNEDLARDLARLKQNDATYTVLGQQEEEEMALYMRAADFAAIQPGGASIGECYAMGVVPIIWGEKSGIEHANRKHIERKGTGIVAFNRMGSIFKKANDATLFQRAVFGTEQARIDECLTAQGQFKSQSDGAARRIAQALVKLAENSRTDSSAPVAGTRPVEHMSPGPDASDVTPVESPRSPVAMSPRTDASDVTPSSPVESPTSPVHSPDSRSAGQEQRLGLEV